MQKGKKTRAKQAAKVSWMRSRKKGKKEDQACCQRDCGGCPTYFLVVQPVCFD